MSKNDTEYYPWQDDRREECAVEKAITRAMYGDRPRCECCGERNPECRWRPAYEMMLCPECPKAEQSA